MPTHDKFFSYEKQAAAVLKHAVLERYLGAFASMLGNYRSTVGFLDGYAGSGVYQGKANGSEVAGSPKIALKIAQSLSSRGQELVCSFVEKDHANYESLASVVKDANLSGCRAVEGDLADHLDAAMARFHGIPLLVFLDPFGTSLDSATTIGTILGRPGGAPTELLLNFSVDSVRRIGARVYQANDANGRDASLLRLDQWLGGDWWRDIFAEAEAEGKKSRMSVAAELVAIEYAKRLSLATGMGHFGVPVQRRPGHLPIFQLMLFFQRSFAVPRFNESVNMATETWRKHLRERDLDAADRRDQSDPRLFGMSRVEELQEVFKGEDEMFQREAIDAIKASITGSLTERASLVVRQDFQAVYGEAIGKAREKHLRAAWKELAAEGIVAPPPKNTKLDSATINRAQGVVVPRHFVPSTTV